MSDDQLDRMVRDADPYRPGDAGRLDGADETLLGEIMSQARVPWRRRLTVAVAAAAALTAALAIPAAVRHYSSGGSGETHQATPYSAPDRAAWSALVLKAAEQNPRLLIDEPGWTIQSVYGFTDADGEIRFVNGKRELEMNWYPAEQYQSYYDDRLDVSPPQAGTIDGWAGDVFTYSANDFALMLKPRDNVFVELRAQGDFTRASFDQLLTHIAQVDVPTWLAAMPPEIVTPGKESEATAKALTRVPLPPKFDAGKLVGLGTNDQYQFGAAVMAQVGCGWLDEWIRADRAGDDTARKAATDALRSSHNWPVLLTMNAAGDYPEVFWEYADRAVAGNPPTQVEYRQGLGCE